MQKAIIIANGKPPLKSNINYFRKRGFNKIICADGGSNALRKLNMIPDYIIGDLDSITDGTLKHFTGKSEIIEIKRQNDTDVEKCLKFAHKHGAKEIVLMGATGDRLDHTLCNIGIVLKFFNIVKIYMAGERSLLIPLTGDVEFQTEPGETISLYGFNRDTLIESKGLKYQLKNVALPFGERESTSNVATGETVKLKITGGIIFTVREIEVIKRGKFI